MRVPCLLCPGSLFFFLFFLLALTCLPFASKAQSPYVPLNPQYQHLVERYEVRSGHFARQFHSSIKPYAREALGQWTDSLALPTRSKADAFNLTYLANDNAPWAQSATPETKPPLPLWGIFFPTRPDMAGVYGKRLQLHASPLLHVSLGYEPDSARRTFMNTRGVVVHGSIDGRLGFYSRVTENQTIFPTYGQEYVAEKLQVPGQGFWKPFKEQGHDFLNAQGYITFKVLPSITVQAGNDRLFIGNGIRSLTLSGFGNSYNFMRLSTQVWCLQYTNIYAQMVAEAPSTALGTAANLIFPKKYMTLHHLSLNLTDNLNFGLFETVIYARPDSLGGGGIFEPGYLNPIIFYRSIEQGLGSPDNVVIGADARWNLFRHLQLYGQFTLDEFSLNQLRQRNGWWGNKFGLQLGLKAIDIAPNLDVQAEANFVRPYTYAHLNTATAYTHYNQPLAHPLGANFQEFIGVLNYQPLGRLHIQARGMMATHGADADTTNWGGDIFKPYLPFEREFGNTIAQGVTEQIRLAELTVSYMPWHNIFADLSLVYRSVNSDNPARNRDMLWARGALRWNIAQRNLMF